MITETEQILWQLVCAQHSDCQSGRPVGCHRSLCFRGGGSAYTLDPVCLCRHVSGVTLSFHPVTVSDILIFATATTVGQIECGTLLSGGQGLAETGLKTLGTTYYVGFPCF